MISENKTISQKRRIYAGIIGGLIGGFTMEIPMVILAVMMGMPADSFVSLLGLLFGARPESSSMSGMVMHLFVGMAIGVIFGIIVNSSKKLEINGFKKGVSFGIISGMVAMVIIGLPILFVFIPPVMIDVMMMNQQTTEQIVMEQIQGLQMLMLIGSLIGHIIYGLTLGIVLTAITKKKKMEEKT